MIEKKIVKKVLFVLGIVIVTGCKTMETQKKSQTEVKEKVETVGAEDSGTMPSLVAQETKTYCGTWASSQYLTEANNMPPVSLAYSSLRQTIRTSISGNAVRLSFSNKCGDSEVQLMSVHIALSTGYGKIDAATDTIVTFSGKKSVTIPAYSDVQSDTFTFALPAITEVTVTIYFGAVPEKLTGHPGSRTTSFIMLGDMVSKERFSVLTSTDHWYFLSAIDVLSSTERASVVCFGDSITDGRGSTTNAQNRWTDCLATKLQQNEATKNISVLNQGIGGTLVSGSGVQRFQRDVLSLCGVKYLIVLYGINDIIYANASSSVIISVYENMIKQAHAKDIRVYGGTILPFGKCSDYSEKREAVRQEVNEWIRSTTSASGGFDAYIDFDEAMKDPADEKSTFVSYNCGDGLHPSPAGYQKMADVINRSLFNIVR